VPFGRITLTAAGRSWSKSISIKILAYKSLVILAVGTSQWMGFPTIMAILERQIGVQQQRGRLGNLTQVGILAISKGWKSKNSGITFKIRGRPNMKYGPLLKMSNISNSELKANINQPESCIVKLDLCFQFFRIKFNRAA
jgi:hypothetical protein